MLTPSELERIPKAFETLLTDAEMRIMDDIIRRVKINGEITRSANWQIYRLIQLGESRKTVDEILKRTLELSYKELELMYEKIIEEGYAREEELYRSAGKEFIRYKDNLPLQQLISAVKEQTKGEFKNITQSLGFARKVNGKIKFSSIADTYQRILDNAVIDVSTGTFDYNTILKRTIRELTNSGIRTVDYATGHSNRVEVAVRRAVMTGLTQITNKINKDNAKELDTDYFEVSWHGTARPTHQIWQGRVHSEEELISICGLGEVDGLNGTNCRHTYSPFIKGISVRTYTDEQLEEMNQKENTPKEYNGKYYTSYEASQRQRKLEALMRKQRQQIKLLEQGGVDENDIINMKCKYRSTMQQYVDFSKKMNLPQQRERIYSDSLGKVSGGKGVKLLEENSSRFTESMDIFNNGQNDLIKPISIQKNLNKTLVGKEILEYLDKTPCNIKVYYNVDVPAYEYGRQISWDDSIEIYASNTKTIQKTAETIIHEVTHRRYNIGGDMHSECVCKAQEYKHRYNTEALTGEQLRSILKEVKSAYPNFEWRRKNG